MNADLRDTKNGPKQVRTHIDRACTWSLARLALRKGGRTGRVKTHIAFHLLEDLVNVTIEDGDLAEALDKVEGAQTVFGSPTPVGIDNPERHMREENDRRRS